MRIGARTDDRDALPTPVAYCHQSQPAGSRTNSMVEQWMPPPPFWISS